VLALKPASSGDAGVVHLRTVLANQDDRVVCTFERRASVRAGRVTDRADAGHPLAERRKDDDHLLPAEVRESVRPAARKAGFAGFVEDFAVGDVLAHTSVKTVTEAEAAQLGCLFRSSPSLHPNVVGAGLVFGWVATLASRDTCGNAVWDVRYDNGAHPSPVVAGDTLHAASKVLAVTPHDAHSAMVTFRLVGVKNARPAELIGSGADLFTSELRKEDASKKVSAKVFEIDRTVLMRRRV
jgi:2-methylfumaryl-CoA hydratase